jgi:hypothetical protein
MDTQALLAILALILALVVPVVMLMRTQNSEGKKKVRQSTDMHMPEKPPSVSGLA